MFKRNGFTLIELLLVVIVLGLSFLILIPKFVESNTESRVALVKALEARAYDVLPLVHDKALRLNQAGIKGLIVFGGAEVGLVDGYPSPSSPHNLLIAMNLNDSGLRSMSVGVNEVVIYPSTVHQLASIRKGEDYSCALLYSKDVGSMFSLRSVHLEKCA